jgi:hypothetical protein
MVYQRRVISIIFDNPRPKISPRRPCLRAEALSTDYSQLQEGYGTLIPFITHLLIVVPNGNLEGSIHSLPKKVVSGNTLLQVERVGNDFFRIYIPLMN